MFAYTLLQCAKATETMSHTSSTKSSSQCRGELFENVLNKNLLIIFFFLDCVKYAAELYLLHLTNDSVGEKLCWGGFGVQRHFVISLSY